jgi:hypothetical protein
LSTGFWMAVPALAAGTMLAVLATIGKRKENASLLKNGLRTDAEIVFSSITPVGRRCRVTTVKFRFLPDGYSEPIEVTKEMFGAIEINEATIVPVCYLASHPYISLLVPYADKQNAS